MLNPTALVLLVVLAVLTWFVFVLMRDVRLSNHARSFDVPVSLGDVFSMRFKKIDPNVVIEALILARQHELQIALKDLEAAYLAGADVEKAVFTLTTTHSRHDPVTLQNLFDASSQGHREK